MKYDAYDGIIATDDLSVFDFTSIGRHGKILKRIEFGATEVEGIYNLSFGDIDNDGAIDDYNISNNGDQDKILATVYYAVESYLMHIRIGGYISGGSTEKRTRLYRIAVGFNQNN